ncbi:hypothetical protein ACKZDW_09065 [Ralstonia syzygii subsp. celebesensis]|uniref:Uncharacterized protein n=1 Tax=blood disease bacterium A2-HR MARDI TaxID=1944648 RepID=A0A1U9VDR6_9RALS|nr:hypothetical protein [Ralstonia syzygii]AQW28822.1 hypothetical protein B0B51_01510 [blood disease bacterium A2-HR MARDI]QQV54629.1 hypothetical protein JK151_10630 [Ralstonia syzygii subsp. celebesensis]
MDYAIVPRRLVVDEGRAAHRSGRCGNACPYLPGTDHAAAWRVGFVIEEFIASTKSDQRPMTLEVLP